MAARRIGRGGRDAFGEGRDRSGPEGIFVAGVAVMYCLRTKPFLLLRGAIVY